MLNKEEIDNHKCGRNYLKKRKDDNQEAIIIRYDEYMKKTKPVLDFFSQRSYNQKIWWIYEKNKTSFGFLFIKRLF